MAVLEGGGVATPSGVPHRQGLQVELRHPDALVPTRAHEDDAGLDLYSTESAFIPCGLQRAMNTGVAVAIPENMVGLVFARSSLGFNHNVTLSNSVGVIDSGFTNTIKVALTNHHSFSPYQIEKGDRIAQLVLVPAIIATPVVVDSLPSTDRGGGGIGSTGK